MRVYPLALHAITCARHGTEMLKVHSLNERRSNLILVDDGAALLIPVSTVRTSDKQSIMSQLLQLGILDSIHGGLLRNWM